MNIIIFILIFFISLNKFNGIFSWKRKKHFKFTIKSFFIQNINKDKIYIVFVNDIFSSFLIKIIPYIVI